MSARSQTSTRPPTFLCYLTSEIPKDPISKASRFAKRLLRSPRRITFVVQRREILLIAGLTLVLSACGGTSGVRERSGPYTPSEIRHLALRIDSLLSSPAFNDAIWAGKIVDLSTGSTVYSRNSEKNLTPASNTKLYTTAAALDQLGPGFRYRTPLYLRGYIISDTLKGDLVVRGSGDPTLSPRFLDGGPDSVFRAWADSIRELGVRVVSGRLIGDDNLFDEEVLGIGWSWDDETYWYSAQIGALTVAENCVELEVKGSRRGEKASISWTPATDYIIVINRTQTVGENEPDRERYARLRGQNTILVESTVAENSVDTECLAIEDPTLFFVDILRSTLESSGIEIVGESLDADELDVVLDYSQSDIRRVAVHTSPPMSLIAEVINKPSHNLIAEMVLKTVGTEHPVEDSTIVPGSAEMGLEAAKRTFHAAGVDTSRIRLVDGSGLSRMNLISTDMTASILRYMWNHPDPEAREAFLKSLPVGGVDGTLKNRFLEGRAANNVRAKTGTLTRVSSLSGYVRSRTGRPIAFALMCNNYTAPTRSVRDVQDGVVNLLADFR